MKRRKQQPTIPLMRLTNGDLIMLSKRHILRSHEDIIGILIVASYGPHDPERHLKIPTITTHSEMIPVYEEYLNMFIADAKDQPSCGPSEEHAAVGMAMQSETDPDHYLYIAGIPDGSIVGACCTIGRAVTDEILRALNLVEAMKRQGLLK